MSEELARTNGSRSPCESGVTNTSFYEATFPRSVYICSKQADDCGK